MLTVCKDRYLDGEEECKNVAEAQHNRCAHCHDDAPGGRTVSILCLLAHMPAPACTCLAHLTDMPSYTCDISNSRASRPLLQKLLR